MKNIIFIGMPGAGKTTIGKEVARTLAWPFFDSDVRLRERIHRDIKELFRESEAAFRQEETETLRELCQKGDCSFLRRWRYQKGRECGSS